MAVMKKVEDGEWRLSNELVLMPGDANQMSGDATNPLSEYPVGTRFTIEKLLEELLIKSDNTAYYILLRNIHQDELKEVIVDIGIEALFSEEGKISAKEYSRIFRALYTSSFLKRENSQYLLELLNKSIFDEFLSHGVPDTVDFPHKYGQDDQNIAYSDSGIVYIPNRPYIITVMVEGEKGQPFEQEKAKAADFMRAISEVTYNYFSSKE
jgi:beta-lactamase class A